jgi:hypothetical protein
MTNIIDIITALIESGGEPVEVDGREYAASWLVAEVDVLTSHGTERRYVQRHPGWKEEVDLPSLIDECLARGDREFQLAVKVHNHPDSVYCLVGITWRKIATYSCNC